MSESDEIRSGHEHRSEEHEKDRVGDEIRKNHERKAAHEGDNRALLLAIDEKPKSA